MGDENTSTSANPDSANSATGGGVNTPNLDKKTLRVGRRALSNGAQAVQFGADLEEASRDRNTTNAVIVAKYDGEQPFSPHALEQAGEDWRNNFPTGFMSGIIDRIVPVPMATIDNARYLTNAKLDPNKFENAEEKSEKFCQRVTRTVRRWRGWRPFCYSLCQEDVLIGYAIVAIPNRYDWRPRMYRSDEGFVPDGTGQHSSNAQGLALNQDVLIHEFVEVIADKEVAHDSGWEIDECVKSINEAMPKSETTSSNNAPQTRNYEDVIREGNVGMSYSKGAKVIQWQHVLVVEPTTDKSADGKYHQKVTHYIVDKRRKVVLFKAEDEYEEMPDVLTLFTLQPGNGKFYGSKGTGKMLVNIHIAIDRIRNIAADQYQIGGLKLLKADPKSNPTLQLRVRHPFAIVQTDANFEAEDIPTNVEDFERLDAKLTSIAEQAANSYIPNRLSDNEPGGARTATEAAIDNARDQQSKVAYLARFWGQFGEMMTMIQRRLCDPETVNEDAKELQRTLKEEDKLTDDEIKALSNCPATEVVQDMAALENQQVIAAAGQLTGNPFIDQIKMLKRQVTALTNPAIADEWLLPDGIDPTVEAENVRQQLIENEMFMLGTSMPVSGRDNHMVHCKVCRGELERAAPTIAQNARKSPTVLDHINAALVHMQAHIDMANTMPDGKKTPLSPEWQDMQDFVKKGDDALKQLAGQIAKERDMAARATPPAAPPPAVEPTPPPVTNNEPPPTPPPPSPAAPLVAPPILPSAQSVAPPGTATPTPRAPVATTVL